MTYLSESDPVANSDEGLKLHPLLIYVDQVIDVAFFVHNHRS